MGIAVVPTDWTAGYTEVCIKWPDSGEWLAILRGLLTLPLDPGYFDPFTGDTEEPKNAIYPTLDQNLHSEVCMKLETGMIMMWPKVDPPTGWLSFNGQMVLKADYPDLYNLLGGQYAETADEFKIGIMGGGFPANYNSAISYVDDISGFGGEEEVILSAAEMPVHTHIQDTHNHTQDTHNHTQDVHGHTVSPHSHTVDGGINAASGAVARGLIAQGSGSNNTLTREATVAIATQAAVNQTKVATNQTKVATNQNAGSGSAHNNLPPYFVVNFIIKT